MNEFANFNEICHFFELGKAISAEPAFGGRLHHVWRLETTSGKFALKVLNEKIMQKDDICAAYERSEEVARAFERLGVPAVPALLNRGKSLHHINNKAMMVFEWKEGIAHKVGSVDQLRARKMGEVLGRIHAINLDAKRFRPPRKSIDPDQWKKILNQTKETKHPIAEALHTNAKNLLSWSRAATANGAAAQKCLILSHGDLDQHNVIWSIDSDPAIIDWESASLQDPTVELLNLCLDWSGFPERVPCKETFLACYQAYLKSNAGETELAPFETAFDGEIGYLLFWLSFSLERSFNTSGEEQEIAFSESSNALRSLCLLEECKSLLLEWLEEN